MTMPKHVRRRLREHQRAEQQAWGEWNRAYRGTDIRTFGAPPVGGDDIARRFVLAQVAVAAIEDEWREEAA